MKLYTEKQVNKAMLDYIQGIPRVDIIKSLTPIELPSDEEIQINGVNQWDGYKQSNYLSAFTDGAKWMRDKILNK